ncbi:MAG: DUF58 domain-containing protein [Chloroflexota bacterium]
MKHHIFLLALLIFVLMLFGVVVLSGNVLALALPLIVYLGTALWYAPDQVNLKIQRQFDANWVKEGTPVTVCLSLENIGSDIEELLIREHLPRGAELLEGSLNAFVSLPAGAKHELHYIIRPRRGEYTWAPLQGLAGEMFALFGQELIVEVPRKLSVRPQAFSLGPIAIRPPQTRGFSGPIPARQAGSGVDFFAVREYQPGDPIRHLNWRMAARHPFDLFTNTQQAERVADVGLILDSRIHINVTARGDSLFEHATRAAASLANSFLNDGNRVALLVYGGSIQSVYPGYGKIQRERIHNALARARLGRNYALESLGHLPTRFFPARSQIVLISPLHPDDVPVLVQLRSRGYAIMLVCPNALDFEIYPQQPDAENDLAYRLANAERTFLLQQVRRIGIQVVDWRVHEPLEPLIQYTVRLRTFP